MIKIWKSSIQKPVQLKSHITDIDRISLHPIREIPEWILSLLSNFLQFINPPDHLTSTIELFYCSHATGKVTCSGIKTSLDKWFYLATSVNFYTKQVALLFRKIKKCLGAISNLKWIGFLSHVLNPRIAFIYSNRNRARDTFPCFLPGPACYTRTACIPFQGDTLFRAMTVAGGVSAFMGYITNSLLPGLPIFSWNTDHLSRSVQTSSHIAPTDIYSWL